MSRRGPGHVHKFESLSTVALSHIEKLCSKRQASGVNDTLKLLQQQEENFQALGKVIAHLRKKVKDECKHPLKEVRVTAYSLEDDYGSYAGSRFEIACSVCEKVLADVKDLRSFEG